MPVGVVGRVLWGGGWISTVVAVATAVGAINSVSPEM